MWVHLPPVPPALNCHIVECCITSYLFQLKKWCRRNFAVVNFYPQTMMVIANIFLCLSLLIHYGQAISATDLAEIKQAIFEDEKMKGIDRQLSDNIMTTGELVTALQNQETFVNELKEAHERETKALKLSYTTLEMYAKLSLPKTCSALKKTGLNETVTAMINPAGLDKSLAAIQSSAV